MHTQRTLSCSYHSAGARSVLFQSNHRSSESLRLGDTSGDYPLQAPCSKPAAQSRGVFSWVLNISKDGGSTTPPGNLCQCSVTLTAKRVFMCKCNFFYFSLSPLPLVLSLDTTDKSLAPSLHPSIRCLDNLCRTNRGVGKGLQTQA